MAYKTGECLIEVTTEAGFTVSIFQLDYGTVRTVSYVLIFHYIKGVPYTTGR